MTVPDHHPQPSLYLAKNVLRSSVVLQAVCGHIRYPSSLDIVFGKETALELAVLSEDGVVQSVCEQPVFGSIKDLRVLPWNERFRGLQPELRRKDLLVLLSDSGKLSFLTFNVDLHRFLAVAHAHLAPTGNSSKDLGRLLAIEPKGCAVAVAAFEDRVAVFPTSISAKNKVVEKGMVFSGSARSSAMEASSSVRENPGRWGTIWSMAFVECDQEATHVNEAGLILVVLLHRKYGTKACEIVVLKCDVRERIIYVLATYDPGLVIPGHLAVTLIEFPVLPGYLLLSRVGDLLLLDLRRPNYPHASAIASGRQRSSADRFRTMDDGEGPDTLAASALLELVSGGGEIPGKSSICAWSWQPDPGHKPRLVLGMDTGDVAIALVTTENSQVFQIEILENLYRCSPCRSLLWLTGGSIAALTEMGDGQILEMLDGRLTFRSLIQNISPIIDFALVDYHEEKQDQMFACCGIGQEGSIRVIRSGISVERLLSTPPFYQGVTGIWSLRMFHKAEYHSFIVMSFVEETRILSVGLNFLDVSESVGFDTSASTLSCGLIEDGWMAQVCNKKVLLAAPTRSAHPDGHTGPSPLSVSWKPQGACIILGAVSKGTIILALSRPSALIMLGTKITKANMYEFVEIRRCQLGVEISCISIPCSEKPISFSGPASTGEGRRHPTAIGRVCVVGTHRPSVELLSIEPGDGMKTLAVGLVSVVNSQGTIMGGCVPESVRLARFDRLYVLCGLRNGMLLRYEWPPINAEAPSLSTNRSFAARDTSVPCAANPYKSCVEVVDVEEMKELTPIDYQERMGRSNDKATRLVYLHLVDVRRIGISPVSLFPLESSLRADIIALSDRPWLLTSRNSQRIAYRSISFQPSTHGTPVRAPDCPNGVLFVADCSLHLVEMEQSKRLNVQRLPLSRNPRHVLYHAGSKMLLVMRSGLISDICCVDPLTGTVKNSFQLDEGEVGYCMQLLNQGGEQVLLVGTGLTRGDRPVMPTGEPESSKGRLLILRIQSKFEVRKSKISAEGLQALGGPTPMAGGDERSSSAASRHGMVPGGFTCCEEEHRLAESDDWQLSLISQTAFLGIILAVSPYLEQYVLASVGNCLYCLGYSGEAVRRLRRFATTRTRFVITSIAVHVNRIAVGDCRDGVLFYSFREDIRKFEQLHCDPFRRLIADCVLVDVDTAVVSDRRGNFSVLTSTSFADGSADTESVSPEHNLTTNCWYHLGEIIMRIKKGSFSYRASVEDATKVSSLGSLPNAFSDTSLVASTLLGSVFIFIQVKREEYELLQALQSRLASHPLTAPVLGNNHAQYRHQGCPAEACQVLDGDMLGQFIELTNSQQQAVLAGEYSDDPRQPEVTSTIGKGLPLEQVLSLFERIHNFLT